MSENNGVRSYKGQVIGDSMSLTFNFRFLLNAIAVFGTIIYGAYKFQNRIEELERKMAEADQTIEDLLEKHVLAENEAIEELESKIAWYEKSVGGLNPLSWKKNGRNK